MTSSWYSTMWVWFFQSATAPRSITCQLSTFECTIDSPRTSSLTNESYHRTRQCKVCGTHVWVPNMTQVLPLCLEVLYSVLIIDWSAVSELTLNDVDDIKNTTKRELYIYFIGYTLGISEWIVGPRSCKTSNKFHNFIHKIQLWLCFISLRLNIYLFALWIGFMRVNENIKGVSVMKQDHK